MAVVVKTAWDRNCYVLWSGIAEGPIFIGTREEMRRVLLREGGSADERLDRADTEGTSLRRDHLTGPGGPSYGWGDEGWLVQQGSAPHRWLPRENLEAFTRAYLEGRRADAMALTKDIEVLPE